MVALRCPQPEVLINEMTDEIQIKFSILDKFHPDAARIAQRIRADVQESLLNTKNLLDRKLSCSLPTGQDSGRMKAKFWCEMDDAVFSDKLNFIRHEAAKRLVNRATVGLALQENAQEAFEAYAEMLMVKMITDLRDTFRLGFRCQVDVNDVLDLNLNAYEEQTITTEISKLRTEISNVDPKLCGVINRAIQPAIDDWVIGCLRSAGRAKEHKKFRTYQANVWHIFDTKISKETDKDGAHNNSVVLAAETAVRVYGIKNRNLLKKIRRFAHLKFILRLVRERNRCRGRRDGDISPSRLFFLQSP